MGRIGLFRVTSSVCNLNWRYPIGIASALFVLFGAANVDAGEIDSKKYGYLSENLNLPPLDLNLPPLELAQMRPNQTQNQPPPAGEEEADEDEQLEGETVLTRVREELDPLGVTVGSYLLFPKITIDETYTTNVFFVENNKSEELITTVKPEFVLNSDWNNHAVNLTADMTLGRHVRFTRENYEDYHGAVDGRFDVVIDEHFIFGDLEYFRLHEGRASPDNTVGEAPTGYSQYQAIFQYFLRLNRLSFTVDSTNTYFDYDDTPIAGAIGTNNDDRDRKEYRLAVKTGYEIFPDVEAFLRVSGNKISYVDQVDDDGFDRDSHGLEVVGGSEFDFGGTVFGSLFAGAAKQRYGDANLRNITTAIVGGNVDWNITTLTTLNVNANQSVQETTSGDASGFLSSSAGVRADHELLRNLLLNANLGVTQAKYKGIYRHEYTYQGGLGMKFMITRNFYTSANYGFTSKQSADGEGGDADYKTHDVVLKLEMQL